MTTYALLIYRTSPGERIPEVEERLALAGHRAVQVDAAAKGELHAVARLAPLRTAQTVKRRGAEHDVTDGPYIETKEWLVGFYLIDCDDESHALERAKEICKDEHHAIEVRPVTWRS